jgi:hypothetical protein
VRVNGVGGDAGRCNWTWAGREPAASVENDLACVKTQKQCNELVAFEGKADFRVCFAGELMSFGCPFYYFDVILLLVRLV